jgi:hypothetical protein
MSNYAMHADAPRPSACGAQVIAGVRLHTRVLLCLRLLSAGAAVAKIVAPDPIETPGNVTSSANDFIAHLGADSTVRFTLAGDRAERIDVTVAGKRSVADMRTCALPKSIHPEGMELLRHDLRDDEYRSDSFTLLFDVGAESDRSFGKLPRIQLTWVGGRLVTALITRPVSESKLFSAPLCDPDVQPNNSLERTRER